MIMDFFRRLTDRFHHHFIPSERNDHRPHSLRRDFLLSVVALTCVIEGFLVTSLFLQSSYREYTAAVLESVIVSLTNEKRDAHTLAAVKNDPKLTLAAQAKANDMAARGYFAHVDPEGKQAWDWMEEAGYDYAYAGENLAAQFYDSNDVVNAWMNSPTHRANVLRPTYRDIGIGIAYGKLNGQETAFVVQLFGTTKEALGMKKQTAPTVTVETVAPVPATETVAGTQITSEAQTVAMETPEAPEPQVTGGEEDTSVALAGEVSVETTPTPAVNASPNALARILSSPRTITFFALSVFLAILAMALVLAVVIRVKVQPVDLLLNGMVVAAFLLTLIAFNSHFFGTVKFTGEPAAVVESLELSL